MQDRTSFVPKPSLAPPPNAVGPWVWLRRNLLYSWSACLFTVLCVALIGWLFWFLLDWGIVNAVWVAGSRRECLERSPHGACWAGVYEWTGAIVYGRYPPAERWRVDLAFAAILFWMLPLWLPRVTSKSAITCGVLVFGPVVAGYILAGGSPGWLLHTSVALALGVFCITWMHVTVCYTAGVGLRHWLNRCVNLTSDASMFPALVLYGASAAVAGVLFPQWGLSSVKTNLWGGLFLTFVIAGIGVTVSLPCGVLLALARRSRLLFIRALVIAYIELLRSVPLITVLFMAVTMLPLFLPVERNPNKLVLVLVAVVLFASAYMAEIVRGGLQAVPLGQLEAARSIGLSRWHCMRLVVLPQALRHMIPNITSSFIGLLKDTTVVAIVGLYDFTRMLQVPSQTPTWIGLHIELFVVGGVVYLLLCLAISRYSQHLERRLAVK